MLDRHRGRLAAASAAIGVLGASWLLWSHAARTGSLSHALLVALPAMATWLGVGAGCALLAFGLRRREGGSVVCARCGYAVVDSSRLLPQCPECGRAWRWFGGTRRGRPVSRPLLTLAGGLLAGLALLVAVVRSATPAAWLRATPRGVLLAQVGRGPWHATPEHWQELERRQLTPDEERWLINALLQRRIVEGRIDPIAHRWLFGRWFLGAMTRAQEERYFGEVISLALDAPSSVECNAECSFSVMGVFRGDRFGLHGEEEVWIVRDFARLDLIPAGTSSELLPPPGPPDPSEPGAGRFRSGRPIEAWEFIEQTRTTGSARAGPGSSGVAATDQPGAARLTVVVHVFIARRGVMPEELQWSEGVLLSPVGTTRHFRLVLNRDVLVVPGS